MVCGTIQAWQPFGRLRFTETSQAGKVVRQQEAMGGLIKSLKMSHCLLALGIPSVLC